ncbi:MAG: CBS domain-containing protein [Alphaproteobacteria bacterium]|nr:CBS domain-containing protein [Alphaproteobacteria bacterium]MDE2336799.1 CBS domain-containing protein [Alphaproteobacteria bacterium]
MAKYTIKDVMVPNPEIIAPDANLREAAMRMEEIDCGIMPVGTTDKLVGMITDRDIALRAIAHGKDPSKTKVKEIMTNKVLAVSEETDIAEAAEIIKTHKIARLVVKDKKGKVSGIVSLSGLIRESANARAIAELVQKLAAENHKKAA